MAHLTRSAEAWGAHLAALLPPGPLFDPAGDPILDLLLRWQAIELERIDQRITDLLREADPGEATEMLPDWERETGLPDACSGPAPTMDARRAQVVQRLNELGGASREYFIGLAELLGFAGATITEFPRFHARSACNAGLSSEAWSYTWRLNLPVPPGWTSDGVVECVIRRLKQSHTHVLFAFVETP